ncbi:hypothetical protein [Halorubrum sp. AJ67]|uniref:hypothetical protein n=1 Tax=Halorubrum sp. AJ67 TaxID=1173487 RepID=UPI0003DDC0B2|nr:hypothetical protein [Halorubrum sp. AJ67]CDK38088.1 hypothetical protein BN903_288 [Halorubrum sp. AJ67]
MSDSSSDRPLDVSVKRLNSRYSDELKDSEIVLREIPGTPRYRLVIEPVDPSEHDHDFQKDLGETFDKAGMRAFIAGLEAAPLIAQRAESAAK